MLPVGTIIKLPTFTDEKAVTLTFDNVIGLEKIVSTEEALTDYQRELRDKINYKKSYKLETEATLNDIAKAISDTKKPISIVVDRNGEKIALNNVYTNKEGKLGIQQIYTEN